MAAMAILTGAAGYFAVGLVFAIAFSLFLVKPFDANTAGGITIGFRLIIVPGVMALWPIVLILMIKRGAFGAARRMRGTA